MYRYLSSSFSRSICVVMAWQLRHHTLTNPSSVFLIVASYILPHSWHCRSVSSCPMYSLLLTSSFSMCHAVAPLICLISLSLSDYPYYNILLKYCQPNSHTILKIGNFYFNRFYFSANNTFIIIIIKRTNIF